MAEKKAKVRKLILKYIGNLREKDLNIKKVYLFGSYAKGTAQKYSDIDLAVISPDFSDEDHLENVKFLWHEAMKISSLIEPLPYSFDEYKQADPRTLIGEIKKHGILMAG